MTTTAAPQSEAAEKLFHLHTRRWNRCGHPTAGSFEWVDGCDLQELQSAYAELVAAGPVKADRLPDGDDPGTYVLSSRAIYPDGGSA